MNGLICGNDACRSDDVVFLDDLVEDTECKGCDAVVCRECGADASPCQHDEGWTDCGRTCQHSVCVLCGTEQEKE